MAAPYAFGSKSDQNKALQSALITKQFLLAIDPNTGKRNDDSIFGHNTEQAVEIARSSFGLSPGTAVDGNLLAALGIRSLAPAPKLTPNPIVQFIAGLALKAALNQLKGYFPMLNAISGYKTYAVGLVSILIGAADWIGWTIPNTATPSPAGWIVAGLVACFGRAGLAKIAEDVVSKIGGGPAA